MTATWQETPLVFGSIAEEGDFLLVDQIGGRQLAGVLVSWRTDAQMHPIAFVLNNASGDVIVPWVSVLGIKRPWPAGGGVAQHGAGQQPTGEG